MTDKNIACPFCDTDLPLNELSRDREMNFEGVPTIVSNLLYSICSHCKMETVTPHQTRINKRTIIEAHKSALGLLTAKEILKLRDRLGISQAEAAQLFGGGVNAFSKYENSAITQTKAMDNQLRLALEVPGAAEYLAAREGVELKSRSEKTISVVHSGVRSKSFFKSLDKMRQENKVFDNAVLVKDIHSFCTQSNHLLIAFSKKAHQSIKSPLPYDEDKKNQGSIAGSYFPITNVSTKKNKLHKYAHARSDSWRITKQ